MTFCTWLADDVIVVDYSSRDKVGLGFVFDHTQPRELDSFLEILKSINVSM